MIKSIVGSQVSINMNKIKRIAVKGVCSVTKKKFLVIFRKNSVYSWRVERVIPTEVDIDADRSFSIGLELEGQFSGVIVCPYCKCGIKEDTAWFKCGKCGYINCSGSLYRTSYGIYSVCGNCGNGDYLTEQVESLTLGD